MQLDVTKPMRTAKLFVSADFPEMVLNIITGYGDNVAGQNLVVTAAIKALTRPAANLLDWYQCHRN